ncbi:MAG: hypothetical protein JW944_00730, partial [Deltaproteobacteria bacterium]|nr:hypothetical protein [Deltaproteobacteria bacterium]
MEKSTATKPSEKSSIRSTSGASVTSTGGHGRVIAIALLLFLSTAFAVFGTDYWHPVRNFIFDS